MEQGDNLMHHNPHQWPDFLVGASSSETLNSMDWQDMSRLLPVKNTHPCPQKLYKFLFLLIPRREEEKCLNSRLGSKYNIWWLEQKKNNMAITTLVGEGGGYLRMHWSYVICSLFLSRFVFLSYLLDSFFLKFICLQSRAGKKDPQNNE